MKAQHPGPKVVQFHGIHHITEFPHEIRAEPRFALNPTSSPGFTGPFLTTLIIRGLTGALSFTNLLVQATLLQALLSGKPTAECVEKVAACFYSPEEIRGMATLMPNYVKQDSATCSGKAAD